jgi:F-type H+-transporting ATPase subunit epsilon
MAGYHLSILTPAGKAYDGMVEAVTAPGVLGSFGVLENHAPMIAGLKPGVMAITDASGVTYFEVGEGVFEVSMGREVIALVDHATKASGKEEAQARVAERKAGS